MVEEEPFPSIALSKPPTGFMSHPLPSGALPPHLALMPTRPGMRRADLLLSSLPCVVNSFKLWREWREAASIGAGAERQLGMGTTPTQSTR